MSPAGITSLWWKVPWAETYPIPSVTAYGSYLITALVLSSLMLALCDGLGLA